jgi:hypothetical protein
MKHLLLSPFYIAAICFVLALAVVGILASALVDV